MFWIPVDTSNPPHCSTGYLDTNSFTNGPVGKLVTFRKNGKMGSAGMQKLPDCVPFPPHFPPISTHFPPFPPFFFLGGTFSYLFHESLVNVSQFPSSSPHFPPFPPFFRSLLDTRILRIWILPGLGLAVGMGGRGWLSGLAVTVWAWMLWMSVCPYGCGPVDTYLWTGQGGEGRGARGANPPSCITGEVRSDGRGISEGPPQSRRVPMCDPSEAGVESIWTETGGRSRWRSAEDLRTLAVLRKCRAGLGNREVPRGIDDWSVVCGFRGVGCQASAL